MQATKPQTAAMGLTDSPVGCAAWSIEKYRAWSDCELADGSRDVLRRFTRDERASQRGRVGIVPLAMWSISSIDGSEIPARSDRRGFALPGS